LKEDTKVTIPGALWYEETIPQDSLFYSLILERKSDAIGIIKQMLSDRSYLQVGGNETVGQGWFAMKVLGE
jgi:CRISPR-associated protein Cmr4